MAFFLKKWEYEEFKTPQQRNSVAWLYRKLFTMTRKLNSENYKIKFFGINFLVIVKNFCSEYSSLLLNQQSLLISQTHVSFFDNKTTSRPSHQELRNTLLHWQDALGRSWQSCECQRNPPWRTCRDNRDERD